MKMQICTLPLHTYDNQYLRKAGFSSLKYAICDSRRNVLPYAFEIWILFEPFSSHWRGEYVWEVTALYIISHISWTLQKRTFALKMDLLGDKKSFRCQNEWEPNKNSLYPHSKSGLTRLTMSRKISNVFWSMQKICPMCSNLGYRS